MDELCDTASVCSIRGYIGIYHRSNNDDVIKWKHFPRYLPFVRGIHQSPVNSPHKGQWRGALTFSLICARINGWVNNRQAGDLRRHRVHYDVTVMLCRVLLRLILPISFFNVTSLVMEQSYDCSSASDATLKNMGKYIIRITNNW